MNTPPPGTSATEKGLYPLALVALVALAAVVFMGKSYQQSLQAMDSSVHARLALDVTSHGLMPVLPMRATQGGHDVAGFNDHPFTLFYLEGWIMRLLGPDAWSARLLPSLFAVACVPVTVWLGTFFFEPIVSLAVGFVLTFSPPFISYGARFQLDHAMIFFILLSFVGLKRRNWVWIGLAAGLGMWMKSPVAFLVFPSAVLSLLLTKRLNRAELALLIKAGVLAALTGGGIWLIEGAIGGWNVVYDYWHRQVFGTAVGGRGYSQAFDPLLFVEALKRRYWPWLPLLLASLIWIIRTRAWRREEVALPLSATLVMIVAVSAMRFKFDHYYFPMYPFLAMLTVLCVQDWISRHRVSIMKFMIGAGLVLPTFLLAMPIELAPEMFPALRKFEAIIQSYGTCSDKILWIDGDQPYGGFNDSDAELAFYANRPTLEATCEQAEHVIHAQSPTWIIVSARNRTGCIPKTLADSYPRAFRFGGQILLGRVSPDADLDLTPLARELQAPKDCEASPLPKNRYYRYE